MAIARRMWRLYEPIHAVTYFSPEARAAFEAAGLRGFWRGYFGGRAAPLGAVPASAVVSSFYGFAPGFVDRAIPSIWDLATPAQALDARRTGAVAALRRLLPADVTEAADLLEAAAAELDHGGRPLSAANAALTSTPPATGSEGSLGRLWQAATVFREHRGDGHVAALVGADLSGIESLLFRAGLDIGREILQPARGWTDEEWAEAADRLRTRGLLDAEGKATAAARALHEELERATDAAAGRPWRTFGSSWSIRLEEILTPIGAPCLDAMPYPNPIGLR